MASIKRRDDGVWRARYRDVGGKEHAKHFARKVGAQRWLDEVTASVVTGTYVDPKAGKETVRTYAERWLAPRPSASTQHGRARRDRAAQARLAKARHPPARVSVAQ